MDNKPDSLSPPSSPPSPPSLRRRNSISTSVFIPAKLTLPSQPFHTSSLPPQSTTNGTINCNGSGNGNDVVAFELASFKSSSLSYTSLKDILPSTAVNSPTPAAATPTCGSAYEISIRNHLVKQAAWAYLQPMSSSPDSSSQHFLQRLWLKFSTAGPITACIRFITLVFDRIICLICIQMNR
ncbi:uncharacterized protein LOC8271107 [Ricinus communis]|uniref:Uncharacterized protein n=1 Tax=Ricinus communis TaxID=3988 RepID=B9SVY6_RICCO|nr:uncharacterized protein LOC8271107 [Ricinus communis]EEF32210.1 conserved hypothetical protein [Ricinus communis]|eukprot:XP_002530155.1 uncharacterized protein LOC8271107 [Ricinus communis]